MKQFKRRVRGTPRQIGKAFPVMPSRQKLRIRLPRLAKKGNGFAKFRKLVNRTTRSVFNEDTYTKTSNERRKRQVWKNDNERAEADGNPPFMVEKVEA